jgi:hypothetical protein
MNHSVTLQTPAPISEGEWSPMSRRGYKDYVDLYFIIAEHHASLQEIIAMAERNFRHEFNSRLFAESTAFLDDVQDYDIDFLKQPIAAADITEFFRDRMRELPLI